MKKYLLLILVIFLGVSCSNKFDESEQLEEDIATIEAYLTANGIVAEKTDSGLYYTIIEEGTGTEHPETSSTVECTYLGYLMEDGTIFDGTSPGQTATFGLTNVIAGWREGIPKLKRNGSGRFFIPSKLGYGNRRQGASIPKNSILIFEVTLVHFF